MGYSVRLVAVYLCAGLLPCSGFKTAIPHDSLNIVPDSIAHTEPLHPALKNDLLRQVQHIMPTINKLLITAYGASRAPVAAAFTTCEGRYTSSSWWTSDVVLGFVLGFATGVAICFAAFTLAVRRRRCTSSAETPEPPEPPVETLPPAPSTLPEPELASLRRRPASRSFVRDVGTQSQTTYARKRVQPRFILSTNDSVDVGGTRAR